MVFYVETLNLLFALGGLVLLGGTFALAYDYVFGASIWYKRFVHAYVGVILLLVMWGGVGTTLLYSEYLGFIPCSLCWLQRVALYPQALMGVLAYTVRDQVFFPLYGIGISTFGLLVALYHYVYQLLPKEMLASGVMPCLADGTADCATKVMEVFGFITFPFLSAVMFAFLIVLYLHMRRMV